MRILVSAIAALALAPAAALAADHNGTVNSTTPSFAFAGGPGAGFYYVGGLPPQVPQPCNQFVNYCDFALVEVTEAGDVTFHAEPDAEENPVAVPAGSGSTIQDLDIYVYASDASGAQGAEVTSSHTDQADETVVLSVAEPGFYLFKVNYALGGGYYTGEISWAPTPVVEPEDEEDL